MSGTTLLHLRLFGLVLAWLCAASWGWGADKNGVSPHTISLPSGPGSLEGLGESFQPLLSTGTASYAIPLALPAGVNDHTPQLTLQYNSGYGNGPAGIGWTFGPGSIARQTDQGVPRYVDGPNDLDDDADGQADNAEEIDRILGMDGEDLVQVAEDVYRTRIEGAFVRYRRLPAYWEATLKDGTTLLFGLTPAGRVTAATRGKVYKWLLERSTDTNGNVIAYQYARFPGSDNQQYLTGMRYGPGAEPWGTFYFVALTYEDRPDWTTDYRSGFLIKTAKRLARIDIGIQGVQPPTALVGDWNADGTPDALIRRYVLTYDAHPHWSLLSSVTQFGADGTNYLPPLTLGYHLFTPSQTVSAADAVIGAVGAPPVVMDSPQVELVDLNGDGLPDMLHTDAGSHTAYLNLGLKGTGTERNIRWDGPHAVTSPDGLATRYQLDNSRVHLADMEGDGIADLVFTSPAGEVLYHRNSGRLGWEARRFMSTRQPTPPAPFGNTMVRTADLDFDKRIDIVKSSEQGYSIWFNRAQGTYSREVRTAGATHQGRVLVFATAGVQLADMNGDRLSDVVQVTPTRVLACANMGHGVFAPCAAMAIPDVVLTDGPQGQVGRAKLTDINGDGLADLVVDRAPGNALWYWLNLGTDAWSPQYVITDMPTPFGIDAVTRWADMNGNGTTDLISADSAAALRLQTVDIGALVGGSARPHLLVRIENGLGVRTRIHYQSSVAYSTQARQDGNPWATHPPFPVAVVARVETTTGLDLDGVPGKDVYVTEYGYRDGYYDYREKEFRGFRQATVTVHGDPTAPTLVTRHTFHTGAPDGVDNDGDDDIDEVSPHGFWEEEALKGKTLARQVRSADGVLFQREEYDWRVTPLLRGAADVEVHYATQHEARTLLYEGTSTPATLRTTFAYDAFGNVTAERNFGALARSGDELFTFTDYIHDTARWIVDRPQRHVQTDAAGAVVAETRSYYDGAAYGGLPLGQLDKGNLTRQEGWVKGAAYIDRLRNAYDAFGNVVGTKDGNGNRREVAYDPDLHRFPVRETIHVGGGQPALVLTAAYDLGLGVMTRSTDFTGHATLYDYNTFGRMVALVEPGDSPAEPTQRFVYTLADPEHGWQYAYDAAGHLTRTRHATLASSVTTHTREESGGAGTFDTIQYLDGLGRALAMVEEAETGFVVKNAQRFNRHGTVRATFQPYATADSTYQVPAGGDTIETHYDALGRGIRRRNPPDAGGKITQVTTHYRPLQHTVADELGNARTSIQDGLERLVEVHEVNEGETYVTRYTYNPLNSLTRLTDAQQNVTTMAYDGLQRKTFVDHPDRGVMHYTYDAASNLIATADARGQRITYTYDGANRLLSEEYHDEGQPFSANRSPDVVYHYDTPAGRLDLGNTTHGTTTNTRGALAWVRDLSGEEHLSYDARGRVRWRVKRIPDPLTGVLVSYTTERTYDAMDRVRELIYPDNDRVVYTYNARGLPGRIRGGPTGHIVAHLNYRPSGQLQRCEYGNGIVTTYDYDPRLRMTQLTTTPPRATGTPLLAYQYTFDEASNIRRIDDLRPATALSPGTPRRNTQRFTYDDVYRLTSVQYPAQGGITYAYDRIGNMLAKTSDLVHQEHGVSVTNLGTMTYGGPAGRAGRVGRKPGESPGPHALTATDNGTERQRFAYDDNGNMTQLNRIALTWDVKDRLVAVENDTMRAAYTYDYTDRRISKKVTPKVAPDTTTASRAPPAITTLYVNAAFEVREHDQPVKYVFNGTTRVARSTGTLDASRQRVQRLRISAGWNLVSLAVQARNAAAQLGIGTNLALQEVYRWDTSTQTYMAVGPGEALPAGTVLWLRASAPVALAVSGTLHELGELSLAAGGSYVPAPGMAPVPLETALPQAVTHAWMFDAATQRWQGRFPTALAFLSDLPAVLAPGQALYLQTSAAAVLRLPDPAQQLRYYHQDHLGSSNIITDAAGKLVEESGFYPFGHPRYQYHPLADSPLAGEPYLFTQKERDTESGLQYFEARYYMGYLGRFVSVDPLTPESVEHCLTNPTGCHQYGYANNNPLRYVDPDGLNPRGRRPVEQQVRHNRSQRRAQQRLRFENSYRSMARERIIRERSRARQRSWESELEAIGEGEAVRQAREKEEALARGEFIYPEEVPAYSVVYRAELRYGEHYPGRSRPTHNRAANEMLWDMFRSDPNFAITMEREFPGIVAGVRPGPRGGFSPKAPHPDLTWHHAPEPGMMELVVRSQHRAKGYLQDLFHSGGQGGYSRWGKGPRTTRQLDLFDPADIPNPPPTIGPAD